MKQSPPTKTQLPNAVQYDHPAYGTLNVVKTSSSHGVAMFGSSLSHKQFVTIEISRASLDRKYHTDFVHTRDMITRFSMTEHQWAMFVASMGSGGNIPITLELAPPEGTNKVVIDQIQGESFSDIFGSEIKSKTKAAIAELKGVLTALENISDSKTISKRELNDVIKDLTHKLDNIPRNFEYLEECLVESKDKVVTAGKIEIEAFVSNYVTQVGIAAMNQGLAPQLLEQKIDTND